MPQVGLLLGAVAGGPRAPFAPCCPTGGPSAWQAGLVAGLRVGQAYGGVPPTWVWVVGVSPQILEHPTSICDTGVNTYSDFTVHIFLAGSKICWLAVK